MGSTINNGKTTPRKSLDSEMESCNSGSNSMSARPSTSAAAKEDDARSSRQLHAATNGLSNGSNLREEAHGELPRDGSRAPLRNTLSCEENDEEPSGDDGDANNMVSAACPKYKSCRDRMCDDVYDARLPSCSGAGSNRDDDCQSGEPRHGRKRTADCRPERSNLEANAFISDSSNDEYSLGSEDGCIYTYRGGEHLADLPSSFISLDMGLPRDSRPLPGPYVARPAREAPAEERNSRASSPDMDYLEMDFDPGPSCDADSEEDTNLEEDLEASLSPEVPEPPGVPREPSPEAGPSGNDDQPAVTVCSSEKSKVTSSFSWSVSERCQPSTSKAGMSSVSCGRGKVYEAPQATTSVRAGFLIPHVNARGERVLVRRTCRKWPLRAPISHHTISGDLVCERGNGDNNGAASASDASPTVDKVNLSSATYHCTMAKKLIIEKPNADFMDDTDTSNLSEMPPLRSNSCRPSLSSSGLNDLVSAAPVCRSLSTLLPGSTSEVEMSAADGGAGGEGSGVHVSEVPRSMVWSEREACERQVTQIATSACGATAVINTFLALGVPVDVDRINEAVGTRQRTHDAPIPRYLLTRSVAGCTAAGIMSGLTVASDGLISARFFPTFPERVMSLSHWLADWISLGAVPIATLNLQAGSDCSDTEAPDAWHHQMIFGVSPRGVFLTNPVECVGEGQLWPQLVSDSVLLVRSRDVLARVTPDTDLTPLITVPDLRWAASNVLGQVVNILREARDSESQPNNGESSAPKLRSKYIKVPCAYRAGITVAALTGSEAHRRLMKEHNLPLLA